MGCGASGLKDCKSEVAQSTDDSHSNNAEIEVEEHKETDTNHTVPELSSEQLDPVSNDRLHDESKEEIPQNQEIPEVSVITEEKPDVDLANDAGQPEESNTNEGNTSES
ncbi:hypothetical protein Smp_064460 [Schistosoma mansoni]|uniref:EKN n=1 Tax=Schistosoma mansoni TaxID=6183 RepID=G4VKC2_SCHMA|nr:hypothetical protein Smp_064460 [Schistosoma mansoni]|eukprot:XP_018652731.1 hypothetical protein Smp_064460 [Schistosoma mansoni]